LIFIWADYYPNIVNSGSNYILNCIKKNGLVGHWYKLLLLRISKGTKPSAKAAR
jgi:hypothetical protein